MAELLVLQNLHELESFIKNYVTNVLIIPNLLLSCIYICCLIICEMHSEGVLKSFRLDLW